MPKPTRKSTKLAAPRLTAGQRAKALKAGGELLLERGLDKVTLASVASRTGLALSILKSHFGTAEHLSAAALENWSDKGYEKSEQEVTAGFGHGGDIKAGLAAIFELQLARYAKGGWWRVYLLTARSKLKPSHRAVIARIEQNFADRVSIFLRAYQARGLVDPGIDPDALHTVWSGILDGISLRQASRQGDFDLPETARQIASILAFGLTNRSI